MTINRTHLAGLCRAIDEIGGIASGEVTATLNRLIAQAQAAPEAEPVAIHQYKTSSFISWIDCQASDFPSALAQGFKTRILYTAPQHDAELVELLRDCADEFRGITMSQDLPQRIDAKLATLSAKKEVKS